MWYWRSYVAEILVEELGVLGEVLIDETLEKIGLSEHEVNFSNLGKFLRQLAHMLPGDVDRKDILMRIRDGMLDDYSKRRAR